MVVVICWDCGCLVGVMLGVDLDFVIFDFLLFFGLNRLDVFFIDFFLCVLNDLVSDVFKDIFFVLSIFFCIEKLGFI